MRVVGLEGLAARSGPPVAVVGDLHRARLADRQRQIDERVARALRQVERRRMVGLAGQRERRAVLEHAGGRCQREAAGGRAGRGRARNRSAPQGCGRKRRQSGRAPASRASGPAAGSAAPAGTCPPARPRGLSSSCQAPSAALVPLMEIARPRQPTLGDGRDHTPLLRDRCRGTAPRCRSNAPRASAQRDLPGLARTDHHLLEPVLSVPSVCASRCISENTSAASNRPLALSG